MNAFIFILVAIGVIFQCILLLALNDLKEENAGLRTEFARQRKQQLQLLIDQELDSFKQEQYEDGMAFSCSQRCTHAGVTKTSTSKA